MQSKHENVTMENANEELMEQETNALLTGPFDRRAAVLRLGFSNTLEGIKCPMPIESGFLTPLGCLKTSAFKAVEAG